ncbi:unnamed protein product [Peronospora destructor]|uniref:Uncharacterized protein n=1 Tax=Peronospora destructor TaxID=86335 RepID=A0AAV0VBI2_9STRA|nr:unnamed protein product [Peronospora destructor]
MYANPIVLDKNNYVLYDVYTTFSQDKMRYNYTLVNGILYLQSTWFSADNASASPTPVVACFGAEFIKLPAINSIVAAVNEATTVANSGSDAKIQCTTGSFYKTTLHGIDYTICESRTKGFTMQSSDMDVSVKYLHSHIDIQLPIIDHKCSSVASFTSVTALGYSLLTGEPIPTDDRES